MSDPARTFMTADAFIAWSLDQPEGERFELAGGTVIRMASERAGHARAKFRIAELMAAAVREGGYPCEVFTDGMAVRIDSQTVYGPDAQLRCGDRLADDAVEIHDPLVVVEVLSPSSRALDAGAKLSDYFRLPSLRHYLIVRTGDRTVIRHSRQGDGTILTTIISSGPIELSPPGIILDGLFG